MSNVQNSAQTAFINPRFDLIRLWIQDHIGQFIVGLLVLTYLGTGFIIGIALQKGLIIFGITLSWIGGMGVAIIAQLIRGTLVYFSQSNPFRLNVNGHVVGATIAAILTIYAGFEVFHLLAELGISNAVKVSVIGIIIAGFFLEVFFLNELDKINKAILVSDPELFERAIEYERKLVEIKTAIGEARIQLLHARRQRFSRALSQNRAEQSEAKQEEAAPAPPDQEMEDMAVLSQPILDAIGGALLKSENIRQIHAMAGTKTSDSIILDAIFKMDAFNKEEQKEKPELVPLELSLNGEGKY